jgi:hypothetical protein
MRRRMIEDMAIRKLGAKTQHDYVQRVIKALKRSTDSLQVRMTVHVDRTFGGFVGAKYWN